MRAPVASITVIIATYNRATLLRGALDALAAQDDPGVRVEVAIADNGSTDDTRLACDEARRRTPRFEWLYVLEPRPGKSHAVNAALARTHGEWVAFTDDDVRPEPGWLAAIARAFSRSTADFLAGRILPAWQRTPPAWLSPALYGALGVPDNGATPCAIGPGENERIMPIGTNMAVRRAAIERVGGLHPELGKMRGTLRSGEDHEFYLRLLHHGCRGLYVPDARVRHLVPADRLTRDYFRRWFHQNGRNVAMLEAGYPARTPMLFALPRYMWRRAAGDLARLARASLTFDAAERLRRGIALLWFAGYAREAWLAAPRRERRGAVPGLKRTWNRALALFGKP
jgi:glucosyl-dolichyl phosphate glucuronosyltransferase